MRPSAPHDRRGASPVGRGGGEEAVRGDLRGDVPASVPTLSAMELAILDSAGWDRDYEVVRSGRHILSLTLHPPVHAGMQRQ